MMVTASRAGPMSLGLVEAVHAPSFYPSSATGNSTRSGILSQKEDGGDSLEEIEAPEREIRLVALACAAPEIISVESHSAAISWAQVAAPQEDASLLSSLALAYWLEVQQIEDGEHGEVRSENWEFATDLENVPVQLEGLRPGRSYAIRVSGEIQQQPAEDEYVKVEVRSSRPATFQTVATPPGTPSPPLLISRARKELKVKWSPPEETGGGGPLSYTLCVCPPPTDADQKQVDHEGFHEVYCGDEKMYKLVKLIPGSRYIFKVKAANDVGESAFSQCSSFSTQATVPSPPEPPRTLSCTGNSITLHWNTPADNGSPVSSFQLERDDGHGGPFQLVYAGIHNSATVGQLLSGVQYHFRVRAENDEGKSMWSMSVVGTTAAVPPSSPLGLSVVSTSRMSGTMSWQQPESDGGSRVNQYQVQLQGKCPAALEHMGNNWLLIFEGQAHACTINSLRSGCTYRARVRAQTSAGWGQWCLPVDITSAPDVPEAPNPPTVTLCLQNSISLCWQPPSHNGGSKVLRYILEMVLAGPGCVCGSCDSSVTPLAEPCPAYVSSQGGAAQLTYPGDVDAAEVGHLLPGCLHYFRLQATNREGAGSWSEWMTAATAAGLPLQPLPPVVTSSTSTAIDLHWIIPESPGTPVLGYALEVAKLGPATGRGPHQGLHGDPNYCPSHMHAHPMSAGTPQLPSPHMMPMHLHPMSPHPPHMGAVTSHSPHSPIPPGAPHPPPAVIQGMHPQYPGGPVGGMQPPQPFPMQQMDFRLVYRGAAANAEAQGLQPAHYYACRVAAINAVGMGPWSTLTMATTAPAPPAAPEALTCTTPSRREVQLSWRAPSVDNGAAVTTYVVEMAVGSSTSSVGGKKGQGAIKEAWKQVHAGGVPFGVISRLQPGTWYQFRVRAGNECGMGPPCAPLSVATLAAPPSAPLKLAVSNRTATSARIRWEAPDQSNGSTVTSYQLEICKVTSLSASGSGSRSNSPPVPDSALHLLSTVSMSSEGSCGGAAGDLGYNVAYFGPDTATKVVDLEPNTRYLVRVSALNDAGLGVHCSPEALTTMLSPPGPPFDLEIVEADLHEGDASAAWVSVRWEPPVVTSSSAPTISYEVLALPTASEGAHGAGAAGGGSSVPAAAAVAANAPGVVKVSVPARGEAGTTARLEHLLPGTSYAVRLRAVGAEGAGHSGWSHDALLATPGIRQVLESLPAASKKSKASRASAAAAAAGSAGGSDATGGAATAGGVKQRKKGGMVMAPTAVVVAPPSSTKADAGAETSSEVASNSNSSCSKGRSKAAMLVQVSSSAAARAPPAKKSVIKKLVSKLWSYMQTALMIAFCMLIIRLLLTTPLS